MTKLTNPGTVAFIGCGNIAHVHMRFLQKVGYHVNAICDMSQVRVELFGEQYGINKQYTNVEQLFMEEKPSIVHILTPPHTHYSLIMAALNAGCNVLVEKPLCQTLTEYRDIVRLAEERGLLVSVDHTRVYNPMISKLREQVKSGKLGQLVKMEYAYDDPSIVKSDSDPRGYVWAKGTPGWFSKVRGGVLTDLLPHPLSVMLSFDDALKLEHTHARVLPGCVIEDLTVVLSSESTTATISLSVNQRPLKNLFTVNCDKGTAQIELRNMYSVSQPDRRMPGIVSRIHVSMTSAWQIMSGFSVNVCKMLLGKAHPYDGLDSIFRDFYASVSAGKTDGLPFINADKVTQLVDDILTSVPEVDDCSHAGEQLPDQLDLSERRNDADTLVLGGTGFIGSYVIDSLLKKGSKVRALCRPTSNVGRLPETVGVAYGDMKDTKSLPSSLDGISTVVHCAAAMSGDWAEFYESTVQGTKNLLSSLEESRVERLVYISSLGVVDYNGLASGDIVDEASPVESRPKDRGFYTRAKVEAEQLVQDFARRNNKIKMVILRPGLVYGQESNNNTQNCGILLDKFLVVFGTGKRSLGLNYVENLAQAIVLAADADVESGSIIQIVDSEQPDVRSIIAEHNRLSDHKVIPLYVPVIVWNTMFRIVDVLLFFKTKKKGTFRYRFSSNSKVLNYKNDYAQKELGWIPDCDFKVSFSKSYRRN